MSRLILTIDDIPQRVTRKIADYLLDKEIPAVFFAVGENLKKDPETAVYVLKKGFLIGNHSWSHPAFSKLSFEEGVQEILRTEELLGRIYEEAEVERPVKLFRFPYIDKGGEKKAQYQAWLRQEGFAKLSDTEITAEGYFRDGHDRDVDAACSFDCQEYNIPAGTMTMEDVMRRLVEGDAWAGSAVNDDSAQIVLLHSHDDTEKLVPGYYRLILEEILRLGGHFIPAEWIL